MVKSSSSEEAQPSQPPQLAGTCTSWAGGALEEETDPHGLGLPDAEERRPYLAGQDNKWEARTKRGGAQDW